MITAAEPTTDKFPHQVEVLVVGLGLAGTKALLELAKNGIQVLGVESKQQIGMPVQCAEYIPAPLVSVLQRTPINCWPIESMLTYINAVATVSAHRGYMINRSQLEQYWADRARYWGADIHCSSRVEHIDPACSTLVVKTRQGNRHSIGFRYLVAADGAKSSVASCLGLEDLACVVAHQYTFNTSRSSHHTEVFLAEEFPGGYGWLFPKKEFAHVGVGVDLAYQKKLKPALTHLVTQMLQAGKISPQLHTKTGGYIPCGGMRSTLVHGPVILTGDAAGLTHPITGAGIAQAIISGEGAAQALVAVLRRGNRHALTEYQNDMREYYHASLSHAVMKRRQARPGWQEPTPKSDHWLKKQWIAYPEYYQSP